MENKTVLKLETNDDIYAWANERKVIIWNDELDTNVDLPKKEAIAMARAILIHYGE